jgi:hypothetical protein
MLLLIQFMTDVVYVAAGKSNSTGHVQYIYCSDAPEPLSRPCSGSP